MKPNFKPSRESTYRGRAPFDFSITLFIFPSQLLDKLYKIFGETQDFLLRIRKFFEKIPRNEISDKKNLRFPITRTHFLTSRFNSPLDYLSSRPVAERIVLRNVRGL